MPIKKAQPTDNQRVGLKYLNKVYSYFKKETKKMEQKNQILWFLALLSFLKIPGNNQKGDKKFYEENINTFLIGPELINKIR